jgi:hypothetical protein
MIVASVGVECENIDTAAFLVEALSDMADVTVRYADHDMKPLVDAPTKVHVDGRLAKLGPSEMTAIVVSAASVTSAMFALVTAIINWKAARRKQKSPPPPVVVIVNETTEVVIGNEDPMRVVERLIGQDVSSIRVIIGRDDSL